MTQKLPVLYFVLAVFSIGYIFLSNSSNPPNGKTGAPNENTCAQCHSGGSFMADIAVTGIPAMVVPNTTYNVTITNSYTGLNDPSRSGFQIVALNASNQQAGTISNIGSSATTVVFGGKTYVEHAPALNFGVNNSVSWTFDWTAPSGTNGDVITFYYASVFGNGAGSSGDTVENGMYAVTIDNNSGGTNLSASVFFENDVTCNGGNNGSAAVLASDGNPPYTYLWSDGQTNATATGLVATNYTCVVTDNSSATASISVIINEPNLIGLNITSQEDITCTSTGQVVVQATGGVGPYSYSWPSGGSTNLEGGFTNPGTYTVSITDSNNCQITFPVQIFEDKEIPTISIPSSASIDCTNPCFTVNPTVTSSSNNLIYSWLDSNGNTISTNLNESLCSGGVFTFQVTNLDNGCAGAEQIVINDNSGTAAVNISGANLLTCDITTVTLTASTNVTGTTYIWQNAAGTTVSTTASASLSVAGVYTLITSFPNGCQTQQNTIVNEDITPPTSVPGPGQSISCNVGSVTLDGSGSFSASGANLTYAWKFGGGNTIGNSAIINVSNPGVYFLEVTDVQNGCSATATTTVQADTNLPTAVAGNPANIDCNNSTLTLNGSGSSTGPNISYIWTTTDGNIVSAANSLTPTINQPGTYTITVKDNNNGCTTTASVLIGNNIVSPNAGINTNIPILDCNNQTLTLDINGSSTGPNFSYAWSTLNGNIQGTTSGSMIIIDAAGTYVLVVTDNANGCTSSTSSNILSDFNPPNVNSIPDITLDCVNSSSTLDASPSNINGNVCSWTGPNGFNNNTFTISPLLAGNYCATITGPNGCTAVTCANVTVDANLPAAFANAPSNLTCANPSVFLNGNGSATGPNFSYFWSTPNGNIINGQTTLSPEVNLAGSYTLTVADNSNGCSASATTTVAPPVAILTNSTFSSISCNGLIDGTINLNIIQGTPPYSYSWSNGSNAMNQSNLSAGSYTVTITDANSCTKTESFFLQEPTALTINTNVNGESVAGANNGNAMANVNGGSPPYTYLWSNGTTTAFNSMLSPGNYTVTVTDNAGCTINDVVTVSAFGCTINVTVDAQDLLCNGTNNGSVTALVTTGNMPYTYNWSNGTTTQFQAVGPGTYTVTVTDATNCSAVANGTVIEPSELEIFIVNQNDIDCNNPFANVEFGVMGGTQPYTYTLPGTGSAPVIQINTGGTYMVDVTDDSGCSASVSFTITEDLTFPTATIAQPDDLDCQNTMTSLDGTGSSTASNISYMWSSNDGSLISGINTLNPTINTGGTYTLEVQNTDNGCVSTASVFVQDNSVLPAIGITGGSFDLDCTTSSFTFTENNPDPAFDYEWRDDNGIVLQTGASITISDCGIYFLYVSDPSNGCISISDAFDVACSNLTVVSDAGIDQILDCNSNFVTLGGGGSTTGTNITYQWQDDNGNLLGSLTTFITDICGTYTLVVTDLSTGCVDTDEVTVNCTTSIPQVSAGEDIAHIEPCTVQNNSFVLDGSGSATGIQFIYSWSTLDGIITAGTENDITATAESAGTYTLTVTNMNTNCSASDIVVINFLSGVPIPDIIDPLDLNCFNETIELDATNSQGVGNLIFEWKDSNGVIVGNMMTQTVSEPGMYTLNILDNTTGCEAEIEQAVAMDSIAATLTLQPITCEENMAMINLDVIGTKPPFTILWNDASTGTDQTIDLSLNYQYTITDNIGCTITGESGIFGAFDPAIEITDSEINPSDDSLNGSIELEVQGTGTGFTFLWSNGATTEDIFDLEPGDYSVTITDADGCELMQIFNVPFVSSTFDLSRNTSIKVFPNPTKDLLKIEGQVDFYQYELYDLDGKLLFANENEKEKMQNFSIDLATFNEGIYLLRLRDERNNIHFVKVVKM